MAPAPASRGVVAAKPGGGPLDITPAGLLAFKTGGMFASLYSAGSGKSGQRSNAQFDLFASQRAPVPRAAPTHVGALSRAPATREGLSPVLFNLFTNAPAKPLV